MDGGNGQKGSHCIPKTTIAFLNGAQPIEANKKSNYKSSKISKTRHVNVPYLRGSPVSQMYHDPNQKTASPDMSHPESLFKKKNCNSDMEQKSHHSGYQKPKTIKGPNIRKYKERIVPAIDLSKKGMKQLGHSEKEQNTLSARKKRRIDAVPSRRSSVPISKLPKLKNSALAFKNSCYNKHQKKSSPSSPSVFNMDDWSEKKKAGSNVPMLHGKATSQRNVSRYASSPETHLQPDKMTKKLQERTILSLRSQNAKLHRENSSLRKAYKEKHELAQMLKVDLSASKRNNDSLETQLSDSTKQVKILKEMISLYDKRITKMAQEKHSAPVNPPESTPSPPLQNLPSATIHYVKDKEAFETQRRLRTQIKQLQSTIATQDIQLKEQAIKFSKHIQNIQEDYERHTITMVEDYKKAYQDDSVTATLRLPPRVLEPKNLEWLCRDIPTPIDMPTKRVKPKRKKKRKHRRPSPGIEEWTAQMHTPLTPTLPGRLSPVLMSASSNASTSSYDSDASSTMASANTITPEPF